MPLFAALGVGNGPNGNGGPPSGGTLSPGFIAAIFCVRPSDGADDASRCIASCCSSAYACRCASLQNEASFIRRSSEIDLLQ